MNRISRLLGLARSIVPHSPAPIPGLPIPSSMLPSTRGELPDLDAGATGAVSDEELDIHEMPVRDAVAAPPPAVPLKPGDRILVSGQSPESLLKNGPYVIGEAVGPESRTLTRPDLSEVMEQFSESERSVIRRALEQLSSKGVLTVSDLDKLNAMPATVRDRFPKYYVMVPAGTTHIDIYLLLRMFKISNHELGHAAKKILLSGLRTGGKSHRADIMEAIATLERHLELEGD